tara:strand:+ start:1074 stop:2159 length:1086 start_codon:yes stop_codon:yes gene_type:complete
MYIAGIGTALPELNISQTDAAAMATTLCDYDDKQKKRIEKLYRLTQVENRHCTVLSPDGEGNTVQDFFRPADATKQFGPAMTERMLRYEECAPKLAIQAAQRALDASGVDVDTITHIVTVSCSGFVAPGVDAALINALGLPATTQRTHVGFMGCHGALNAIRVANGYVCSQPNARVLIVAVELCSLHYQYSEDDETNLANGLFSDGAAALVAMGRGEIKSDAWRCVATGSCMLPDSAHAMTWKVRDHGFQMTLSREVPSIIRTNLVPWMGPWLEEHGYALEDIKSWAVHPGGPAILQGVREALSLTNADLATSWEVLRAYGNMSSPTVVFVIEAMQQRNAELPCVALGFGPGLAAEAVLFA